MKMLGIGKMEKAESMKMVENYIQRKRPTLLSLAKRYGLDISEREDIVQNMTFDLFEKVTSFRGKSSFDTFAYRIMINELLMYLRKKKRWYADVFNDDSINNSDNNWLYEEPKNPEELYIGKEREKNIGEMLNKAEFTLNKRDAETFAVEMQFISEGDYAHEIDIAEILNVPKSVCKQMRYRMRKNLSKSFDKKVFF